jgi:hypothetical protein
VRSPSRRSSAIARLTTVAISVGSVGEDIAFVLLKQRGPG